MNSHFLLESLESLNTHLDMIDSLRDNSKCLIHCFFRQIHELRIVAKYLHLSGVFSWESKALRGLRTCFDFGVDWN